MIKIGGYDFKNPELIDTITLDTKQSVRRAYSGHIYSMRLREQLVFHLAFKNMPYSQAQLMNAFLNTAAPFTYIDYEGVSHSVRMQDQSIEFSLDNAGHGKALSGGKCVPTVDDWVSFEINLEEVQS